MIQMMIVEGSLALKVLDMDPPMSARALIADMMISQGVLDHVITNNMESFMLVAEA